MTIPSAKILLIEDDPAIVTTLRHILQDEGCNIVSETTAKRV